MMYGLVPPKEGLVLALILAGVKLGGNRSRLEMADVLDEALDMCKLLIDTVGCVWVWSNESTSQW